MAWWNSCDQLGCSCTTATTTTIMARPMRPNTVSSVVNRTRQITIHTANPTSGIQSR